MEKVFVVFKEVFYSEEAQDSFVVVVCSTEELASKFIDVVRESLPSGSKTSYFYESFNVI